LLQLGENLWFGQWLFEHSNEDAVDQELLVIHEKRLLEIEVGVECCEV
jgi:hypothetical protein